VVESGRGQRRSARPARVRPFTRAAAICFLVRDTALASDFVGWRRAAPFYLAETVGFPTTSKFKLLARGVHSLELEASIDLLRADAVLPPVWNRCESTSTASLTTSASHSPQRFHSRACCARRRLSPS
jgi:hypothetical protein